MRKLNIFGLHYDYIPRDPQGFRAGMERVGHPLGARMMAATVYELPPGEAVCPFHYHYGNEEWLLVLDGSPAVRTSEGEEALEAGPRDHLLDSQQAVGRRVSGQ